MTEHNNIVGTCLIGPAGCGKTTIVKSVSKALGIEPLLEREIPIDLEIGTTKADEYFSQEQLRQKKQIKKALRENLAFISDIHPFGIYSTFRILNRGIDFNGQNLSLIDLSNRFKGYQTLKLNFGLIEISQNTLVKNLEKRNEKSSFINRVLSYNDKFRELYDIIEKDPRYIRLNINGVDFKNENEVAKWLKENSIYFPKKKKNS